MDDSLCSTMGWEKDSKEKEQKSKYCARVLVDLCLIAGVGPTRLENHQAYDYLFSSLVKFDLKVGVYKDVTDKWMCCGPH